MALFRNQNAVRYNTSARGYATKTSRKQQTPTGFSKLGGTNGKKRAVFFVGSALVLLFATAGVLRLVTGSWTGARAATYNNPYYGRCMPFPALRPSLGEGARDDNGNGGNGQCVQALQFALNNAYGARLSINGVFDAKTKQAVVALQNSAGTKADAPGTVGVETWSVIENTMKQKGGAGYQTPAQIWQNGQAQITGITPAHNNSPIGYIDSCKLEGTTTVFRGWAYDYDIESVRVNLAIAGSTGAEGTVSSNITGPRHAAIEAWLPTQKNPFAKRKAYEFEWKVTTLQNDRNYTIGGVLKNHGPGVDTVIDVDINNFPGGVVPKSCTKPAPPAPVVVTPAPATTPATPKPAAQTALNHDPTGYIDTCEVRGSKTVFKGWMYDVDAEVVNATMTVSGGNKPTRTIETNVANYRTAEINAFLESKDDGSRPGGPKRKAYGFEEAFTGLQNDRTYSVGAMMINKGEGANRNIRFNQNNFKVDGQVATIPSNCMPAPDKIPTTEAAPAKEPTPIQLAPDYSHDPIAYVDSCELKDGKTVIYGWAYDPDGTPDAMVAFTGAKMEHVKDRKADIKGYRTEQINKFLPGIRPGTPLRDAYGFKAEFSGLYKGNWYNVYGDVGDVGGTSRHGFTQIWGDKNAPEGGVGYGFVNGRIPDDCLNVAPPVQTGGGGGGKPSPSPVTCDQTCKDLANKNGCAMDGGKWVNGSCVLNATPGCDQACQYEKQKNGCIQSGGKWVSTGGGQGPTGYCDVKTVNTGASATISKPSVKVTTTYKILSDSDVALTFLQDETRKDCLAKGKVYVKKTVTVSTPYGGTSTSSNICVNRGVTGSRAAYINLHTTVVVVDKRNSAGRSLS